MSPSAGIYGGCMYLGNLVIDAVEPQRLGRFWERCSAASG
jgi:hypothetical protein